MAELWASQDDDDDSRAQPSDTAHCQKGNLRRAGRTPLSDMPCGAALRNHGMASFAVLARANDPQAAIEHSTALVRSVGLRQLFSLGTPLQIKSVVLHADLF